MIRKAPITTTGPMSKAEAKALTDRIRRHIDSAWQDITAAYEGKAWKALSYASWEAYVRAEFDMGRSRSYQLLDQGRVIRALSEVTGDVSTSVDISEAQARDIKDVLPAVTEEIKARVAKGEKPKKAVAEVVSAKRSEKEKAREERKAKQADNDRTRDENRAKLPPAVQAAEAAKVRGKGMPVKVRDPQSIIPELEAEIEELREANASLEAEVATLKADHAKWEDMRVQWEIGGFEVVVADLKKQIKGKDATIERESREKVSNLKSMKWWRDQAIKLGYSANEVIDLNEAANG